MKKCDCFYGIYPIRFVWHGAWNDPELIYKKHSFNYWDIENLFWDIFRGEPEYHTVNLSNQNEIEKAFSDWIYKNGNRVKSYLNYLIELEDEQ